MKTYIELHEEYEKTLRAKYTNFADLLRAEEGDIEGVVDEIAEIEDGARELTFDEAHVDLIQDQVRGFCAVTLKDKEMRTQLHWIHVPSISARFGFDEDDRVDRRIFTACLVKPNGAVESFSLDLTNGDLYKGDYGDQKINNELIKGALQAFYEHDKKLEDQREQEILDCAKEIAQGNELLEGILQCHLAMNSTTTANPYSIETAGIRTAKNVQALPEKMDFYRVGRNASHEFYLGIDNGKVYGYSSGEGPTVYIDKNGQIHDNDDIDRDEYHDEFSAKSLSDIELIGSPGLDQYISGPYASLSDVGYIGHF